MSSAPDEVENRRLHHALEHAVKAINRDAISAATGAVTPDHFTRVAEMVACLRARYLHAVLKLGEAAGGQCIDTDVALELKRLREAYGEALEGFSALEHALERGYMQLVD